MLIPQVYSSEDNYTIDYLSDNLFNDNAFNVDTTSGSILYMFVFLIIVALVIVSEITRVPIIGVLTGILGAFLGLLFVATLSSIVGFIFIIISVAYMIRAGVLISK